ncbi:MAG TPA: 5-oxoprolinase subunit PxpB [Puia sp.]|nr:5-oxoprolinase subunit PxpB [Puia sp.]
MAAPSTSYKIYPLGDSAITLDLGNVIDEYHNIQALAVHDWLQAHRFPGLLDIIVAYSSVSVFYDPAVVRASEIECPHGAARWVEELLARGWREVAGRGLSAGEVAQVSGASGAGVSDRAGGQTPGRRSGHSFRIPVCYDREFGPDLPWVAAQKGLAIPAVIELHCAAVYRVYMIGFLPGFAYMGIIPDELRLPRKERPVPVAAGGVGIAGMQTGIYPLNSPGGWQIIGRTPLKLFDPMQDPPIHLQTGDHVQFYSISPSEFRELAGRHV